MTRRVLVAAALLFLLPPAALATTLEWRVASGYGLEQEIDRLARIGFEVEAAITQAPEAAVLLQRPCCRNRPAVATYEVVWRAQASRVSELDGGGWVLRTFATDRAGGALAVFARPVDGAGAPREYRSVLGNLNDVAPELEALAAEGFRPVAATGRTLSHPDWILMARASGSAPREVRLVDVDSAKALEEGLARAAGDGYGLDTAWSRGTGRFSLTGPSRLAALATRPRGETRPVAQVKVTVGSEPSSSSGRLVAATVSRSEVAFVQRDGRTPHRWVRQIAWPSAQTPTWDRWSGLEQELRSHQRSSVGHSWVVWSAGVPSRLYLRERDEEEDAGPARSLAPVPELPVPPDAEALGADGGAPWAAWVELQAGIRRGDLAGTRKRWTGEVAKAWEKRVETFKAPLGLGFSEKSLFKDLPRELPTDPVLKGGWQRGDAATLRVEGTVDGRRGWSDLGMVREDGAWKLAKQGRWNAL